MALGIERQEIGQYGGHERGEAGRAGKADGALGFAEAGLDQSFGALGSGDGDTALVIDRQAKLGDPETAG